MLKACKYRIYPTVDQQILMAKHFGCVRLMYNVALDYRKYSWQGGVSVNYYKCAEELKLLKKEYSFLKEVNSQSLQKSLKDLDNSFSRFFKKQSKYPKFKSKYDKQSFHCPQFSEISLNDEKLFLPKFKDGIEVKIHRKFKGEIRSCTVSKTASGKYFVSILVENNKELPIKKEVKEETAVGADLGIKNFIIMSDGKKIDNPQHLRKSLKKVKFLSKQLNKKQPKSNRRNKAKKRLAKAHEKVANQRKDFLHKASNEITNRYDTICLETLMVKNMVKNHNLALSISDVGWGMFKDFVKYKCEFKGKNFLQIGTFESSSKTCNCCGYIKKDLKLSEREWTCPCCNEVLDRDDNAAINVKNIALKNWRVERSLLDAKVSQKYSCKSENERAVDSSKIQNVVSKSSLQNKFEAATF